MTILIFSAGPLAPFSKTPKTFFGKKMSDSDPDSNSDPEEELFETPQLVLETYKASRLQKNPRLEHFKNIIRQNQGKNKIPLPDLDSPRFLAKKSREKKSGSLSKNPSGKKSGEMIMKYSTT